MPQSDPSVYTDQFLKKTGSRRRQTDSRRRREREQAGELVRGENGREKGKGKGRRKRERGRGGGGGRGGSGREGRRKERRRQATLLTHNSGMIPLGRKENKLNRPVLV